MSSAKPSFISACAVNISEQQRAAAASINRLKQHCHNTVPAPSYILILRQVRTEFMLASNQINYKPSRQHAYNCV